MQEAQGLEGATSTLPDTVRTGCGRGLAVLAHRVFRVRRKLVESQIAASFPDHDEAWVRNTARRCYRHYGEEITALAGGTKSIERRLSRVRDPRHQTELIQRTVASGPGAVLVAGHLGSWELAGSFMVQHGIGVTAVAVRQKGGWDRRLLAIRERLGVEIVHLDEGALRLRRALREGRCVSLIADQHAYRGSVHLPYLGRPAWTRLGPARLALRAGVPLAFGAMVREGDGYGGVFEVVAPEVMATGDPVIVTKAWLASLERAVRRWPEQYFWFHRRWKDHPAGTRQAASRNLEAEEETGVNT